MKGIKTKSDERKKQKYKYGPRLSGVCVCVCFWYSRTYEDICLENYHGSGDACHQGDIFQGPTD